MKLFAGLLLLGAAWLASCQAPAARPEIIGSGATVAAVPAASEPEAIALGEAVYAAHCASCHGAALEGESDWKIQNEDGSFRAPPHDASGHTWHHGDELLLEAIRLGGARFDGLHIGGTSNMPAFVETLTEREIAAVLAYIKNAWPEDVRGMQGEATLREAEQAGGN